MLLQSQRGNQCAGEGMDGSLKAKSLSLQKSYHEKKFKSMYMRDSSESLQKMYVLNNLCFIFVDFKYSCTKISIFLMPFPKLFGITLYGHLKKK